jgi:Nucleotidyl transferase of unknown function (DUF2204)
MPADVPAALADLAAAFAALGVRWYVFGAQAVIAAGVPRLTADIDVTVELPRGGPRALIAALARAGIALRPVGDVATFIAETRVIPAIHAASQLPIDVVLAGPGLEEDMLARALRRPVGGTDVPFVDTADLIALKILAGRDKDLEDVRALGRAGLPGRSLEIARQRVAELGALIDDSTLLATFDRLIPPPTGRAKATKRPRPTARKKRSAGR